MPLYVLTPKKQPSFHYNKMKEAEAKRGDIAPAELETAYERSNPWHTRYDRAYGFVVRAPDEATARRLANAKGDDEKDLPGLKQTRNVWLKRQFTDCKILESDGPDGIILQDFRRG
jgi:hypothetical protein